MNKLLNTLYVLTPETYLSLDGETVVVLDGDTEKLRVPLHTLEAIAYFGYKGASPALMGACIKQSIRLSFFSASGRFLAAVSGETNGNVLLRRTQYRWADDLSISTNIARGFLLAKIYNNKWILERATRDHPQRIDVVAVKDSCSALARQLSELAKCNDLEAMRGIEGSAAERYFSHFDQLILVAGEDFRFCNRNRRPPMDRINALLSFLYTLLSGQCAAALQQVGLDPYVGFLHRDRPGRMSLALDLMEEFRGPFCDRMALTLVNNRVIKAQDFEQKENGAVLLNDNGRRTVITAWQERKKESITHPYLSQRIPWGLLPFVQATLLARYMRGDLDAYPPLFWKS